MPLKNYKLLMGRVRGLQLDDDSSPHVEVLVQAKGESYRIAVNVRSAEHPHDLLYRRFNDFQGPLVAKLEAFVEDGVVDVKADRPDLALDFVADDLFEREQMSVAPYEAHGPENDLKEFLLPLLQSAILDDTRVFAFGEMWGPETQADAYFHFKPGRGIHDIHMNQGNSGSFASSNGPRQDGALLLRHPSGSWTAIFLAFQTQSWGLPPVVEHPSAKQASVAIIGALVNAANPEEGRETVTLFNRSDREVNLQGWTLGDRNGRLEVLGANVIGAGEALRIIFSGQTARLANDGGEIHLVSPDGSPVHSVSYGKSKDPEGWSLTF